MTILIAGIDKSALLAGLYNASKPQGLGFLHFLPEDMTVEEAQGHLDAGQTYFDYLNGRVMKVEIGGDYLDPWGYDRDNSEGAAQSVVDSLSS